MNKTPFPKAVQATLWSYDTERMDLVRDKERIITNVLNHGTRAATDWLRSTYTAEEIKAVVSNPRPGEWNKKSLNLWSIIFGVKPKVRTRF